MPTAKLAASSDPLVHAFGTTQAAAIRSELNKIVRGAMAPLLAEAAALHDWNAKATRLLMQMGDLMKTPSDPDPDFTSLRASQDICDKDAVEEVDLVEASLKIGGDALEESCVLEAVKPVSLLELPLSPRDEASIPEGVGPSEDLDQVGSGRLNGGSGPVLDLAQDGTLFADDQACDEAPGGQDTFLASVFTSPCPPLLQVAARLHSAATRAAPPGCAISSHGATDKLARSSRRLATKPSSGLTALEKAKMVMLKKSGAILKEEPTSMNEMSKYRQIYKKPIPLAFVQAVEELVQMGKIMENDKKESESGDNAQMSSTDVEMGEIQLTDMKQSETASIAQMSSPDGVVGEIKENDNKQIAMVGNAQMTSTDVEMGEIQENESKQSETACIAQMSSIDREVGEIKENDNKQIDMLGSSQCINAYTYCLRAKENLTNKAGGKVCSSCGLFVLKLMEEWTGHELAHPVTQNGLKLFRKQLPFILHNTALNMLKGTPEFAQSDTKGDPSDILMWDSNGPPPTEFTQLPQVANAPTPPLKIIKKSFNKNEALSKLRNYILSVNDNDAIKQIWVKSSKPYPISISLKQLKDLLNDKNGIDTDSFNMAVRTLVTDSSTDPKKRLPFDKKREIMAMMCERWPGMEFHVSECNSILVPYRPSLQSYILFVFNLDKRTVTLIDPNPEPEMYKPGFHHKYIFKLKEISFYLNIALGDAIKGWKDDVFLWRRITPCGLPINNDSLMSGFLVLSYMRWWNGQEVPANVKVGYALRNKAVIHMLSYMDNESEANIPQHVKDLVKMVGSEFFL
ncbi:hypothetical protein ACQ4PT_012324 [Festuca glaucescens]